MGDRTNITDARQHDAEQAAGVIEQAMRNEGLIDKDVRLMGEIIAEALDAAGFDVVLRADPDTSDELFTEARRLLDAYPEGVFRPLPEGWQARRCIGVIGGVSDDVWVTPDAFAAHVLRTIALPVIAALLERAVTAEAATTLTGAADYIRKLTTERDAERAARERAEAEARQLREAIGDPDELRWHRWHCEETGQGDDLRELLVRIADAADAADVAVAEGAEDRGQTDAS